MTRDTKSTNCTNNNLRNRIHYTRCYDRTNPELGAIMTKRLIGRIGIATKRGPEFITYRLCVRVKNGEYGNIYMLLTAQETLSEPDLVYALRVDQLPAIYDYEFRDALTLLDRLQVAASKQTAPRATLTTDGKPIITHCQLARFLQGAEKLGLYISRFDEFKAAYEWAYDYEGKNA